MDDMTIGEVMRSLGRLEISQREQTAKLDNIDKQTTKTNSRVDRLETDVNSLKRDRDPRTGRHDLKRADDRTDVITVQIPAGVVSAKTVTFVVSSVLAGLIAAWKTGLFQ